MGELKRLGCYLPQVGEAAGLANPHIPEMTPQQVLESRRKLLEANPPTLVVRPPRVPERFENVRFESSIDRPDVQGFAAARSAVQQWVRRVAAGEPLMLALIGSEGVSKSHLAYCAAWALYEEHRIRVPCFEWYELVDRLRYGRYDQTAAGTREVPAAQIRQDWHATAFCIIDELRPTSGTDFDAQEMTKFSMQRYARKRSVLLTCNWSSLADIVGKPAADRYTQITLVGPSFRGRS